MEFLSIVVVEVLNFRIYGCARLLAPSEYILEHEMRPLHIASLYGFLTVASVLIDKGADVAAAAKDGSTPLHWASWDGHQELARLLIDKGVDVSAADKDGTTPLH
ncbi:ankyrin repeat-containing domain protein [Trichophaea hybrida]|nr:ankyrin repeat-containing domain protein [Trichophaea hybrida]